MNFPGNNIVQGTLPQFSELTSRSNSTSNVEFSHNGNNSSSSALELPTVQSSNYATIVGSNQNKQQFLVSNKYNTFQ